MVRSGAAERRSAQPRGADVITYRLGINTCFAVKRWPQPERWAALVRDELGLDLVQHSLDLVDLDSTPDQAVDEAERLRAACDAAGLTLHSTFTGLAAYSSNLLLHPDPAARGPGPGTAGRSTSPPRPAPARPAVTSARTASATGVTRPPGGSCGPSSLNRWPGSPPTPAAGACPR